MDMGGGVAGVGRIGRRGIMLGGAAAAGLLALGTPAFAALEEFGGLPIRAAGDPKAPAQVQEWFSLDCSHCARFSQEVFPEVKAKLIDTGKLYYVFRDFPLSRPALMAAMVARSLPETQYLPFITALLASQDRWLFAEGVDPKAQVKKLAELAGMPGATYDAAIANDGLQKQILAERAAGQKKYSIDSTPTFIFGNQPVPGEIPYDTFAGHLGLKG